MKKVGGSSLSTQIIAVDGADIQCQRGLLRALAQGGFSVKHASSLPQAARIATPGAVVVAWLTEPETTAQVAGVRGTLSASLIMVIPDCATAFLIAVDLYGAGADDCLTAPVDAHQLAGSISMLSSQQSPGAGLPAHCRPLLPIEQRILTRLAGYGGHPVTLAQLAQDVWGQQRGDQHAILRVFLHLIGRKLAEPDRLVTHPQIRLS